MVKLIEPVGAMGVTELAVTDAVKMTDWSTVEEPGTEEAIESVAGS